MRILTEPAEILPPCQRALDAVQKRQGTVIHSTEVREIRVPLAAALRAAFVDVATLADLTGRDRLASILQQLFDQASSVLSGGAVQLLVLQRATCEYTFEQRSRLALEWAAQVRELPEESHRIWQAVLAASAAVSASVLRAAEPGDYLPRIREAIDEFPSRRLGASIGERVVYEIRVPMALALRPVYDDLVSMADLDGTSGMDRALRMVVERDKAVFAEVAVHTLVLQRLTQEFHVGDGPDRAHFAWDGYLRSSVRP